MKYFEHALEARDRTKIDKLNKLTNTETFWSDVRMLCRRVTSDHSINRWQCLAEIRYYELLKGCNNEI